MPDTNQTPAVQVPSPDPASGMTPARKRENPSNSSAPVPSANGPGSAGGVADAPADPPRELWSSFARGRRDAALGGAVRSCPQHRREVFRP